ncbi:MAG: hypothetical protein FWF12_05885 [Betaproteobacteria bacterium]|nr:hypothetical protein [Betaproteobacteria bacterium]
MNMPISPPLQLSPPQRFDVPPVLRRALLCCLAAFVGTLLLWPLSDAWRTEAETERDNARASTHKTAMQLTRALDTESARAVRAKRFALIKTTLENTLPEKSEPAVPATPVPAPVARLPKRRFVGTLWRDGRIVAQLFDGDSAGPTAEPTIRIGNGIPGTTIPGQSQPLQDGKAEP